MIRGNFHALKIHQRGQAIAEYLYVLPILVMLIFGAIQFGFIYQAKYALTYATFVGTRQGALNHGQMNSILDGLESGLTPLFTHGKSLPALKNARQFAHKEITATSPQLFWVYIVNPNQEALSAYSANSPNGDEIPNDNLMYRSTDLSGVSMNIQDANLLKVRVTYCYKMFVPIINKLIYNLVVDPVFSQTKVDGAAGMLASSGGGSASLPCTSATASETENYRIPITAESVVRMQSTFKNPGKWIGP